MINDIRKELEQCLVNLREGDWDTWWMTANVVICLFIICTLVMGTDCGN